MNYSLQAKEAAGIFPKNANEPHYLVPSSHPVRRVMTAPSMVREMVYTSHPQVEALLIVVDAHLKVIYLPESST